MPRAPRKYDLTFYFLKPEAAEYTMALAEPDELTPFPVPEEYGFTGTIFVRAPATRPPWWLQFLRQANPAIPDMLNTSTAAILLLTVDGRKFAMPFSHGRNLLALDMVVRDFGLRVALNTIHPDTLRSVDARTFEELSIAKKTQTSRPAGLETFSLNYSEEILKAVTGKPADENFAHRITGADAAKLTYTPVLASLGEKCRQLLSAYASDAYKERYEFIDHMREIRDRPMVDYLDSVLIQRLRQRDFDALHMAPPDASDWTEIENFAFDRGNAEPAQDLEPCNYVGLFEDPQQLTLKNLQRDRVGVIYGTAAEPHFKWTVYDTIVCEVQEGNSLYVLTAGSWYRIEPTFAEQVLTDVTSKTVEIGFLPAAGENEKETAYNERAAAAQGHHLFDMKLAQPGRSATALEFCDLVTADRNLVHVKRKTRSSTLSHLFAQGVNAAETFYSDPIYRARLKQKAAAEISAAAAEFIPDDRPVPADWRVIFAVIASSQREWPRSLPFFSQLNFRNAADRLTRFGFKVGLARIPLQET